jgi:hypothetical protein
MHGNLGEPLSPNKNLPITFKGSLMDHNRKVTLTAIALIIIVIVSSISYILITQPDIYADLATYTAQAQKIFDDAKAQVEKLRNVTIPYQTKLHVITIKQATDMWGGTSNEQDLIAIHRQENIYRGLFLITQNDSLVEARREWTANWAAATAGKDDIYVIKENFHPWDMPAAEATFVHEFTHVWEPQLSDPTSFDMDKSHISLVEGDSSFMSDYYKEHYTASPQLVSQRINGVPVYLIPLPADVHPMPDTVNNLNWFPYTQGKTYVQALFAVDGFQTLNKAYQSAYTPSTTEQILHPDKYFANESAQTVTSSAPKDAAWTAIQPDFYRYSQQYGNQYGEYFIQNMLGNWLKGSKSQEANEAATGWAGDNFTYYEKGTDFLFTWNTKWDTTNDTTQFFNAFTQMMSLTGANQQSTQAWLSNGRYLTVTLNQDQNTVLIVCSTDPNAVQSSQLT